MTIPQRQSERRKFWGEVIARHKHSGKTVGAFCQENGVCEQSFYVWRKRLTQADKPVGFALVETPSLRLQRGEPVELILSSGERLRICPGADAATLRLVLSVLREPR